ncbi:MAG: DNA-3-methyladenine glycosylase I [Phycisphaerales bacterium]
MTTPPKPLLTDDQGVTRCWWCADDALYQHYHDTEWGFPVTDDTRLFEKLCLEGFQAGLSWLTILRKRENFRAAFGGFDIERVSRFNRRTVDRLLRDEGIIRHRGKIEAAINNAKRTIELVDEFGSLAAYVWQYEPQARSQPRRVTSNSIPSTSPESVAMSKDLKRRGWSFIGPTTIYAFMQAMGLVDDHLSGCRTREEVEAVRGSFTRPPCR